eukprot:12373556-Karenia_brevis.AAC.1
MVAACGIWLNDTYAPDTWSIVGDVESHRFALRFLALPRTAASQAKKAHDLLRPDTPGGVWTD